MEIANSEAYRPLLESVIDQVSTEPVTLIFVDDVHEWCADRNGANVGNPIAVAIRDGSTKEAGILLRKHISEDRVQSVIGRLFLGEHSGDADRLVSNEVFLVHTVLHELAHLLNNWSQEREDDCDGWAFARLAEIAI